MSVAVSAAGRRPPTCSAGPTQHRAATVRMPARAPAGPLKRIMADRIGPSRHPRTLAGSGNQPSESSQKRLRSSWWRGSGPFDTREALSIIAQTMSEMLATK